MSANNQPKTKEPRGFVTMYTLIFSGAAIVILAAIAIIKGEAKDTMTIFNICLPVFASWVGTILAFYFGKANFESANAQVSKLLNQTFSQDDLNKTPVKILMKPFDDITYYMVPAGKASDQVILEEIYKLMNQVKNRMVVVDADQKPVYMIHLSLLDAFKTAGKDLTKSTVKDLIDAKIGGRNGYGLDEGFIVVAENTSLAEAKAKLDAKIKVCQDVFITKTGTATEPLTGWLSNTRLARLLQI